MNQADDHRWDLQDRDDGCLPESDEAHERKFEEWQVRDWPDWLAKNLTFPFTVTREEDEDDAYFAPGAAKARAPARALTWRGESPRQAEVSPACDRRLLRRGDTGWGAAGGELPVRNKASS